MQAASSRARQFSTEHCSPKGSAVKFSKILGLRKALHRSHEWLDNEEVHLHQLHLRPCRRLQTIRVLGSQFLAEQSFN